MNTPAPAPDRSAPLMMSISGVRGVVGRSLTPELACRYGAAYGSWLRLDVGATGQDGSPPMVVLGRDSRTSGPALSAAVASGLMAVGCTVRDVGVLSTPGVAVAIAAQQAQGAIVVTASHNPLPWNGIKPLREDGVAPPPEQAERILARYHAGELDWQDPQGVAGTSAWDGGAVKHVERVLEVIDVERVRSAELSAVIDSVNGAGGAEAALLCDRLWVRRTHLHAEPTGLFPHNPEPTAENLTELAQAVPAAGADVGFAQDPDADRLAIVDELGRYLGEEYTLALCVDHAMPEGAVVAANLSTSRMIDDLAGQRGGRVVRSPVGEANVAGAMRQHNAQLGGEGNGGIIHRGISQVRDSVLGMALVLELLATRKQKLSAIADAVPRYAILKAKAPVDEAVLKELESKLREAFAGASVDTQDGVRLDQDRSWLHVRPSNTEPIIRLIAEAPEVDAAQALIDRAKRALGL